MFIKLNVNVKILDRVKTQNTTNKFQSRREVIRIQNKHVAESNINPKLRYEDKNLQQGDSWSQNFQGNLLGPSHDQKTLFISSAVQFHTSFYFPLKTRYQIQN